MFVTTENLVFVMAPPEPGKTDALAVVFDVNIREDNGDGALLLRISGFRYFEKPAGQGYVMPPQIKASGGARVRPVWASEALLEIIEREFDQALNRILTIRMQRTLDNV